MRHVIGAHIGDVFIHHQNDGLAAIQQVRAAHQTGRPHRHGSVFIGSGDRQESYVWLQDVVYPVVRFA